MTARPEKGSASRQACHLHNTSVAVRSRSATASDRTFNQGNLLRARVPLASLIQVLAVAEHLSFRNAASALGTSQSSVSTRVKALEEDLGILLFERNTRGVRLTDAGRQFVTRVTAGIDELDHAVKAATMAAHGERGRLCIGIQSLPPHSFLMKLIAQYREFYPTVNVEIRESTARDALMYLRAGKIDVAFLAGAPDLPDCHSRQIWSEPLLVVLSDQHPLAQRKEINWPELAQETFLVRHHGTGPQVYDHILLRFAGRWPRPSIIRCHVERCTLLLMVGQGFGVTIVGAATSFLPTPGCVFLPIADEPEPFPYSAIWSPYKRDAALHNLLYLADEMGRAI